MMQYHIDIIYTAVTINRSTATGKFYCYFVIFLANSYTVVTLLS